MPYCNTTMYSLWRFWLQQANKMLDNFYRHTYHNIKYAYKSYLTTTKKSYYHAWKS